LPYQQIEQWNSSGIKLICHNQLFQVPNGYSL
jgi:hypothetical protein